MAVKRITDLAASEPLIGEELVEVSQESEDVTITGVTISAAAADNSFNDAGNGFVTAGFAAGDRVRVRGFTGNVANNLFAGRLATVAAGKITLEAPEGDLIVDDAAGESVTISKWTSRRATAQEIADLAGSGLPEGGTTGQALVKLSDDDFDVDWDDVEGSGGGGGGAYELIANIKLVADGAFPAIDTTGFRSVRMLYSCKRAGADGDIAGFTFRFNGSATGYYSKNTYAAGNSQPAADNQGVNGASGNLGALATVSAGSPRWATVGFVDFTNLDSPLYKGWVSHQTLYRGSSGQVFDMSVAGFWDDAAVVNSIALQQTYAAGSSIQVIGIRSDVAPNPTHAPGGPNSLELTPLPAFQNSWVDYDTVNFRPLTITKTGRVVTMEGLVGGGANNSTIITLPVGWRPPKRVSQITLNSISAGQIIVEPTGVVRAPPGSGTPVFTYLNFSFTVPEADAYNGNGAGTAQGGAFPSVPVVGQRFYRTDRNIEYVWDGTRWLSTQLHIMSLPSVNNALSGDAGLYAMIPAKGIHGIWLERFEGVLLSQGGQEWDVSLYSRIASGTQTLIATLDGAGNPSNQWANESVAINAVLDVNAAVFYILVDEIADGGTFNVALNLHYRLIG